MTKDADAIVRHIESASAVQDNDPEQRRQRTADESDEPSETSTLFPVKASVQCGSIHHILSGDGLILTWHKDKGYQLKYHGEIVWKSWEAKAAPITASGTNNIITNGSIAAHAITATDYTRTIDHPDDQAVDRFAAAMKRKLARKRREGSSGWDSKESCSQLHLSQLLREHVEKGDPLDVGNFAMMLHQRGERIASLLDDLQGE